SDLATLFLTLDATVELVSPRGRRELSLAEFVRGPWETARRPDELLASVRLSPWPTGTGAAYVKFGVHERPTLGIAVALRLDGAGERARVADARVAIGCVSPRPMRMEAAEARVNGVAEAELGDVTGAMADAAAESVDPADDLHGSAEYKREMVAVFVRRALRDAGAVQCGFCTSGMLLTARALLRENAAPSREDILHYLRGSLCRCTGYRKIVEAIMTAARTTR